MPSTGFYGYYSRPSNHSLVFAHSRSTGDAYLNTSILGHPSAISCPFPLQRSASLFGWTVTRGAHAATTAHPQVGEPPARGVLQPIKTPASSICFTRPPWHLAVCWGGVASTTEDQNSCAGPCTEMSYPSMPPLGEALAALLLPRSVGWPADRTPPPPPEQRRDAGIFGQNFKSADFNHSELFDGSTNE